MNNDPALDGKYLGTISKDFVVIAETLREASYQIRVKGFSDFPIFPISKTEIPLGKLLIPKEEMALDWNIYTTYVDEFVQRKLIDREKLNVFKESYKDPDEFCCLFVVDKDFTNFVYIPYPENQELS